MTAFADSCVAEGDKENAGLVGKAVSKQAAATSRRVLSNRANSAPVRNAPLSTAMSAAPAGNHVPQTPSVRTNQVTGLLPGLQLEI